MPRGFDETDAGSLTAIVARGEVPLRFLAGVARCLDAADLSVAAFARGEDGLWVVVPTADGPDALRTVEDALDP
jgi:hypothetical protein